MIIRVRDRSGGDLARRLTGVLWRKVSGVRGRWFWDGMAQCTCHRWSASSTSSPIVDVKSELSGMERQRVDVQLDEAADGSRRVADPVLAPIQDQPGCGGRVLQRGAHLAGLPRR